MKIVKFLEVSDILLKHAGKECEKEKKKQKCWFLWYLGASMLGNMLVGKVVIISTQHVGTSWW